jgi:hypothetical protein
MDTLVRIKCGNCHNTHATVDEVRECHFPSRRVQRESIPGAVASKSGASFSSRFVKHPYAEVTVPQLNKISGLGGDVVYAAKLNRGEASDYIERLIAAKETNQMIPEPVPTDKPATIIPMDMLKATKDGRYAARQDETDMYDFFRVSRPKSGRFAGAIKVQTQHSDLLKEMLVLWPSGRVSVYNRGPERNLLLAILDPRSAGIRYGRHIGKCMKCGKTLTDNRSRYYGIGPDCEQDWPETIEEVDDMFGPYYPGKEIE